MDCQKPMLKFRWKNERKENQDGFESEKGRSLTIRLSISLSVRPVSN